MWEWIILFFAGAVRVRIPACLRTTVMDWLFCADIRPYRERPWRRSLSFVLRRCDFVRFVSAAEACGWDYGNDRLTGLPAILGFLRKRPGIAAGFAVLFFWCLLSQNFIWRVEIEGNKTTSDAEITALLSELGCGVGDWIPGIDYDWVHANFRARSESIAWLSVY